MYKLSYEKCVCFIFLVMVAFLSCSGFRIDKLAMTDISKRNNPYTSSPSLNVHSELLNRLIQTSSITRHQRSPHQPIETSNANNQHRVRHSRKSKAKHREAQAPPKPTSRIDTIVIPKFELDTFRTITRSTTRPVASEKFAQIPPSDVKPLEPTAAIVTRSQRSPERQRKKQQHRKNQHQQKPNQQLNRQPRNKACQEQDVGRKACRANTVVLAKAESMTSNRTQNRNYSVSFRVIERFKEEYAVEENLRLTFLYSNVSKNCESDLYGGTHGVVQAKIQQSKEYYLFLNSTGNHHYTVLGVPVLKRKKKYREIERIIKNVTSDSFVQRLKDPNLTIKYDNETGHDNKLSKIKLVCKVRGYPIPLISWKKNDVDLHSNNKTRITYSSRDSSNKGRRSTLVIKTPNESDSGRYHCVATGVNGKKMKASQDIHISNEEPCPAEFVEYCFNGGTCYNLGKIQEYYCTCPDGFGGSKCETKEIPTHIANSNMSQTTESPQVL